MVLRTNFTERQTIRKELFKKNQHCVYCNCLLSINKKNNTNFATIEHLTPKSESGSDDLPNLALACKLCNGSLRSSRSSFIGVLFKDNSFEHSSQSFNTIQTIMIFKNQQIVINNILNFIKTDYIDEAMDFIEKGFGIYMRGSFLSTIKKYIHRTLKSIDSIIITGTSPVN